jgi:hypothetical protein
MGRNGLMAARPDTRTTAVCMCNSNCAKYILRRISHGFCMIGASAIAATVCGQQGLPRVVCVQCTGPPLHRWPPQVARHLARHHPRLRFRWDADVWQLRLWCMYSSI